MTGTRGALARAAAVAALLPLAAGALVAAAPAAGAAVTAPGNGTVYTSYSTVEIRADYPRSTSDHRLTLTSPGGPAVTIATAGSGLNGGTMAYSLDTGCWTYPSSSCSGRRLAPNGTWTVTQSGGASSTTTFVTRIRPAAPASVTAAALNPREVRVSWRLGEEPDLTGWAVREGSTVVADNIGRSACEGSVCSAVIGYPQDGTGEHTYTVQAFRSTAPGSSSTLESDASAPASATLEAPAPAPSEGSGDGGSTGGGEQPSGDGGTGSDTGGSGSTGGSTSGSGAGGSTGGSGSGGSTGGSGSGGSTGGSGSGGSTGGSGSGGSTGGSGSGKPGGSAIGTSTSSAGASADQKAVAQRKAFALGFSAFGPKLGIPKLPPLPQSSQAPAIAPELPDGTYEPTLGFEDQVLTERVPVEQTGPTAAVRSVVGSALDSERLVRSTAGALVLLLLGAHLRRWLGSAAAEDH
jgi:hypothetical protein